MKNFKLFEKCNRRIARRVTLIAVLLAMCMPQAWAWIEISSANVYYDNSSSNWDESKNVVIAIERLENWANVDNHGCGVFAMGRIANTKLWRWAGSFGYNDINGYRFGSGAKTYDWYAWWYDNGQGETTSYGLAGRDNWANVSGFYQESMGNVTKIFGAISSDRAANLSKKDISTFPGDMNYTQNVYYSVCEGAGSYSKLTTGTTPAKIQISSYKFVSEVYDAVSSETPDDIAAGGTTRTRSFTAGHTATTQITVSNIVDGYEFMGWYDAASGGNQLEDAEHLTYTYYPKSACDVYARFRKTTYSLAGENWNTAGINWAAGTVANGGTRLMTTTDGITYSTTMTGETLGGSTRSFKLIKNQAWDANAIAANTAGVTKICYNGTLGDDGNPNHNFTLAPYLAGAITVSYNTSTTTLTVTCEEPIITFSKDGGDGGTSSQKTYSTKVTSSVEKPSKTGYKFDGYWSDDDTPVQVIDKDGNWKRNISGYTDNSDPCKWSTSLNSNHTFTAHWTAKTYNLTLNQGNGTGASSKVTMTYNSSSHASITAPTPPTGYSFVGWYTGSGGTGSMVMNASGVLQVNVDGYTGAGGIWTKDGSCTLFAKYTANYPDGYIYITDVMATPVSPATSLTLSSASFYIGTGGIGSTFQTNRSGYEYWARISGSSSSATLTFSSELDLSSYSEGVDIYVWWGSDGNHTTSISVNGGDVVAIDNIPSSAERNLVREATYHTGVSSLSSIVLKGSNAGVTWFRIGIKETEAPSCSAVPTVSTTTLGTTTTTTQVVNCAGISSLGTGTCTILDYGFVYGTSEDPTVSDNKVQVGTTYTTTNVAFDATTIESLTPGATYYVRAYATNGYGTAYGTGTSFTTHYAITTGSHTNGSVTIPSSAAPSASVAISATPSTGYTFSSWTIKKTSDGSDVTESVSLSGTTSATFNMPDYAVTVDATFSCTTPTITGPSDMTVCKDDDSPELSVSADANGGSLSYQWYSNTANSTTTPTPVALENCTTATYSAASTSSVGTIYYYCVVTNTTGSCSANSDIAAVTVTAPTAISSHPSSIDDAVVGEEQTLTVSATGTGTLTYQWYTCKSDGSSASAISSATNESAITATLSITPSAVGTTYYKCVVHSECGSDKTSNVASILAKNGISPTLTYNAYSVAVGSTLTATLNKDGSTGSVTYISSNDAVATVASDGTVTGVSAGTVTITATIAATSDYWSNTVTSSTITVTAPTYDVTHTLYDVEFVNGTPAGSDKATRGTDYEATFEVVGRYTLPTDVTVTIGGVEVTKDTEYTWNSSTGELVVIGSYITGDIEIEIVGIPEPIPTLITYTLEAPDKSTTPLSLVTASIVTVPATLKGDTLKNFTNVTLGSSFNITGPGKDKSGGTWTAKIGDAPSDSTTTDANSVTLSFDIHDDYELNVSSVTLRVKSVTNGSQIYRAKLSDGISTVYGRVAPEQDKDDPISWGSFSGIKFKGSITLTLWVWGGKEFRLKTPIQIDGTLTKKPAPSGYAISEGAHTNGTIAITDGSSAITEAEENATVHIEATPSTGYNFTSWTITKTSDASDVTSSVSLSGQTAEATFTMPSYGVTVNATFSLIDYTITYHDNGGSIISGEVTSYNYGTGATLPTNVTRDDYRFMGWYDNSTFDGSAVTTIGTSETGNKEYWAKWAQLYRITKELPSNGSFTVKNSSEETISYAIEGETVYIDAEPADHYSFGEWSIHKTYVSGTTVSPAASTAHTTFTMPAYNVTINAIFEIETFSLTYDKGGATGDEPTDPAAGAKDYGTVITVPGKNTLAKSTDEFVGWLYNGVTLYLEGQTFTMTEAVTLTAVWNTACPSGSTTLFSQNFSSVGAGSVDYVENTGRAYTTEVGKTLTGIVGTGDNLFTSITCNAKGSCGIGVNSSTGGNSENWTGKLGAYYNNTSGYWSIEKTSNFATTAPTVVKITFDALLAVVDNGTSKHAVTFLVGSGFSDGITSSLPSASNTYTGFSLRTGSTSTKKHAVCKVGSTTLLSSDEVIDYNTMKSFTWVINNSGSNFDYTDPNGETQTLANGTWDLWMGTSQLVDGQARASAGSSTFSGSSIQNLYIGSSTGVKHEFHIDNIVVTDLNASGSGSDCKHDVTFAHGSCTDPKPAKPAVAPDRWPSDIAGVPDGKKIVVEDPICIGYAFLGWYDNEECTSGHEVDITEPITGDMTVYAKWETNVHTFVGGTADHVDEWEEDDNWEGGKPSSTYPYNYSQVYIKAPAVMAKDTKEHVGRVDIVNDGDENNGHLTISSGAMLIVYDKVNRVEDWDDTKARLATTADDLYIGSEYNDNNYSIHDRGGLNGALIQLHYDSEAQSNAATVQFACLSWFNTSAEGFDPEHPNYTLSDVSQYIGIPFTTMKAGDYKIGDKVSSMLFEYSTWESRWSPIWENDDMYPFRGYDILWINSFEQPKFDLTGTLVSSENQTINLREYSDSWWQDYNENLLANSWTAPIDITKFEEADFNNAEATIYMFNAGTAAQYGSVGWAYGKSIVPGQYSALPINLVKDDPEEYADFSTIPSMQSFSIITAGDDASITLDYKRLVYDGAVERGAIEAMHAPKRVAAISNKPMKIKLGVQGLSGMGDLVRILEREDFTNEFDNGWEASKLCGVAEAPSLYALTEIGMQSITAVPDVEGLVLTFRAGSVDDTYTFSFDYNDEESLYLYDTETNVYTPIQTGSSYTFTATDKKDHNRFIITRSYVPAVATGIESVKTPNDGVQKVLINDHIYIIRGGRMYDATGKMLK